MSSAPTATVRSRGRQASPLEPCAASPCPSLVLRAVLGGLLLAGCTQAPRFEPAGPLELLANIDDDDGDQVRDGLDGVRNGPGDEADLRHLSLAARCRGELQLRLEPATAAEHLHVFEGPVIVVGGTRATTKLPCGEHALAVEAVRTRSGLWDGRARLVASANERTTELELRVAPVVFPDVTHAATRVFAVDVAEPKAGANRALLDALRTLDAGLTLAPGAEHFFERWMQDALSLGESRTDAGVITVVLEMDRPTGARGLERFAASQLGPDVGLARPGRDETTTLSYGGNIEVIPPHRGFPRGRLVVGGAPARRMGPSTASWLAAQEVQGPPLELDTSWLETGHLDELVAFVPSDGGWTGFVASPRLAWETLETQRDAALRTRDGQATASALLQNAELRAFNLRLEERLSTLAKTFTDETGAPLIELPQLFEPNDAGLAVALHPSVINLVSLGPVALVGATDVDGGLLEPVVAARLQAVGVRAVFVDAAAYHPFGGGLHCGVEVQRR